MNKFLALLHVSAIAVCLSYYSKAEPLIQQKISDPSLTLAAEPEGNLVTPPALHKKNLPKKRVEKKAPSIKMEPSAPSKNKKHLEEKKRKTLKNTQINKETNTKHHGQINNTLIASSTPDWLRIDHKRIIRPKHAKALNPTHRFTQALIKCYNESSMLKSKLREYYSIAENLSQATAGWRPDISAQASTGYSMTDQQTSSTPNTEPAGKNSLNPQSVGINIKQNLFAGGGTIAATKSAENQLKASRADFISTLQQVLIRGIKAYMGVWLQREQLRIIKESEDFYRRSLADAQAQQGVGESSITDVAQAEFSYNLAVAKRKGKEGDLKQAEAVYVNEIGEEPPAILPLPQPIDEIMYIPHMDILLKAVEKYDPAVIQKNYDFEASKNDVDASEASLIPSLDLQAGADRALENSFRNSRQNDVSLTLRLNVPLYTRGGTDWSQLRKAEQTAIKNKYSRNGAISDAVQNAKQYYETFETAGCQILDYTKAERSGEVRIEGTRQEYVVGELKLLDVLQAESDVTDARMSLAQARYDYIVNGYNVLATVGELTPDVLQLNVQVYDLDTYPQTVRNQLIG